MPAEPVTTCQPYWAARVHLLEMLGRKSEARDASLTDAPALRTFLLTRPAPHA